MSLGKRQGRRFYGGAVCLKQSQGLAHVQAVGRISEGISQVGRGVPTEPEQVVAMKCAKIVKVFCGASDGLPFTPRLIGTIRPTESFSNGGVDKSD